MQPDTAVLSYTQGYHQDNGNLKMYNDTGNEDDGIQYGWVLERLGSAGRCDRNQDPGEHRETLLSDSLAPSCSHHGNRGTSR